MSGRVLSRFLVRVLYLLCVLLFLLPYCCGGRAARRTHSSCLFWLLGEFFFFFPSFLCCAGGVCSVVVRSGGRCRGGRYDRSKIAQFANRAANDTRMRYSSSSPWRSEPGGEGGRECSECDKRV